MQIMIILIQVQETLRITTINKLNRDLQTNHEITSNDCKLNLRDRMPRIHKFGDRMLFTKLSSICQLWFWFPSQVHPSLRRTLLLCNLGHIQTQLVKPSWSILLTIWKNKSITTIHINYAVNLPCPKQWMESLPQHTTAMQVRLDEPHKYFAWTCRMAASPSHPHYLSHHTSKK